MWEDLLLLQELSSGHSFRGVHSFCGAQQNHLKDVGDVLLMQELQIVRCLP
jgi:hypothetical protein